MNLDQAIRVALAYETGVHQVYSEAMAKATDQSAKRIFQVLCDEEEQHLAYLRKCLDDWQKSGKIQFVSLRTAIPPRADIENSLRNLRQTLQPQPSRRKLELDLLKKALEAEMQTIRFYRNMIDKLDSEGRTMFMRFVEIEEGHMALVQAEIDSINQVGFWFDIPEFRLENQ